jgi:imidazolonepropionase-like amidohydrolase
MASVTAFVNASVFDGKGATRVGQTVVIEGGKIRGVGQGEAPSGAQIIDLEGRTLMPGLTIGHWHGEYENIGPPLFSSGRGGVGIGTEEPPLVLGLMAARSLQTALMSGVTRIISGACGNDADWQLKLAIERGLFDGPRLTACSRHVITTGDYEDRCHWWKADMMSDGIRRIGGNVIADGPEQVAKAVRQEILRGAEVIKLLATGGHGFAETDGYRGMSREELRIAVQTAHERGVRVRAHVCSVKGILECLEVGVDIIDHADAMNDECIEAMLKNNAILVPSMLFSKLVSYGGVGAPTPGREADMAWDNMSTMLAKANAAGVTIVPGDDFGAQGMEHELGVYVRELLVYIQDMGIPAADVLRWATSNGAKLGLDAEGGEIAEGKTADIVVINGNPVENMSLLGDPESNLDVVMVGGRFVKNALSGAGRIAKPGGGTLISNLPRQEQAIAAE